MQRESKVLRILESSKKIEYIIIKTYRKIYPSVKWHPSVRNEQMPNFVSFLYDLIISLKYLPSNEQFVVSYMSKYYRKVQPEGIIYHTYVDRANKAYQSLVRDLHFYFKLKESELFDHVQLSYAYDIEAKQDLVVSLGDKKLGLQLFEGDDSHTKWKEKQSVRRKIILGYPDYYMPLKGKDIKPKNICSHQNEFLIYTSNDVKLIYSKLLEVSSVTIHIDKDPYILPKPVIKENNKSLLKNKDEGNNIVHSFIYVGDKEILADLDRIRSLLERGIRIEWISPHPTLKQDFPFEFGRLFENVRLHHWQEATNYSLQIFDGQYSKSLGEMLQQIGDSTTFNFEQFKTEHATTGKHLIVEAGAGSGKTETMISRLIYLLHTKQLTYLEEVVMITFTNEAADNIKAKLMKRLYRLYEITGNIRYIAWSEEVTSIRILTIPSFAKTIIQDFSADIGLGQDFLIRSLTIDRRKIINEELDRYISTNKLNYKELGEIREYEWREIIDQFWNQLEKKGIPYHIQNQIEWGKTSKGDKLKQYYYRLVIQVLANCEKKFNEIKLMQNVFTVNDLTQKISDIERFLDIRQLSKPFKFLFVDEFQDTDDVQINLVKTLIEIIEDAQLFVVGDIKQSIYRFRGANYTAFDMLSSQFNEKNVDRNYRLKKNYRTESKILKVIEDMFDIWRNDSKQILPKEDKNNNRLEPTVYHSKYKKPYLFEGVYNSREYDFASTIRGLFNSMKIDEKDENDNNPTILAVLVRTNYQAEQMRDILTEMRKRTDPDIVFDVVTGGNLFSTDAARDLLILFNALNYEKDPESYFALYQTPFTSQSFNPVALLSYEGDLDKFRFHHSFDEVENFKETLVALRIKPPLHAIYQFIANNPFEKVLATQNMQPLEIEKYRLNLYRILELATEEAATGITSIHRLKEWLRLQVASNREEEEMQVDISKYKKMIKVLTVHKAKGLEFDTVLIPYTYQNFEKTTKRDMIVAKFEDKVKAGWKIGSSRDEVIPVESPLYSELKANEFTENIREEARLLYVALTRAKNRLVVIYNKSNSKINERKNWSDLIRLGRGETS